jgi:hypothetical protein
MTDQPFCQQRAVRRARLQDNKQTSFYALLYQDLDDDVAGQQLLY